MSFPVKGGSVMYRTGTRYIVSSGMMMLRGHREACPSALLRAGSATVAILKGDKKATEAQRTQRV